MPGTRPEPAGVAGGRAAAPGSAWAPFRHRWFAAMWSAQLASNIGSWMQTVGAQWLMLTLTSSATYVALVQTASSLPVVLFAVLAGAAGDLVDRRRTGASSWRLWQDAADPGRIEERFVVASWDEHIRQHERVTGRDQQRLDRIRALTKPDQPPVVTHWLTPPPGHGR